MLHRPIEIAGGSRRSIAIKSDAVCQIGCRLSHSSNRELQATQTTVVWVWRIISASAFPTTETPRNPQGRSPVPPTTDYHLGLAKQKKSRRTWAQQKASSRPSRCRANFLYTT